MIRVPVVLLALTVHEFCHAYFALRMGDPTACRLGRCTLNPLKHLDPLGTICLMFAPIGWAKPVPINPLNFHDWKKGVIVSTAAGPLSNAAQALLFALLLRGLNHLFHVMPNNLPANVMQFLSLMYTMFIVAVVVNVGLAVFNCLPLYPLDGFHIMGQLMRPEEQRRFYEFARFGPMIVLGLVLLGNWKPELDIISRLIRPPTMFMLGRVAGLPMGS